MLVLWAGGRPDPTDPTRRYWTSSKSFTCDLCNPSVTRSSVCSWILVSECNKLSLITCSLHLWTNLLCRMILPEAWCCQSAIYLWFLLKLTLLSVCSEIEPCVLCIEHLWAVVRWLWRTGSTSLASVSNHSDHQNRRFPSYLNTMNLTGRVEVFLFLLLPPVQREFSFIDHSLNYYPQSWKKFWLVLKIKNQTLKLPLMTFCKMFFLSVLFFHLISSLDLIFYFEKHLEIINSPSV